MRLRTIFMAAFAACFFHAVSAMANDAESIAEVKAAVCIGISMGAEFDMLAFLTGRYFGLDNFGRVYGILFTSFLIGTSAGPVVYGMVYESLGSYIWVLFFSLGLMLVSAVITSRLPRYS